MTEQLRDTLIARADRAPAAPTLDEVMRAVSERAEHRARRRRNAVAAGGGALAVAALTTATIALAPTHSAHDATPAGAASSASIPDDLVPADPAPASAPVALGLVPPQWQYLGANTAATTYGVAGSADPSPDVFVGKIAVIVGTRYDDGGSHPLTIAGHPARITHEGGAAADTLVEIVLSASLDVTIQVPDATHLTRDDIVAMADTLDVRDTSHPASG